MLHCDMALPFGMNPAVHLKTGAGVQPQVKLIVAVIKPFRLDPVREALLELGVVGMTVSEVQGFGRQKGQTEIYRGAEYTTNFVPKVRVEVAVADALVARASEVIQQAAHTGAIGDGKIFILGLEGAVRIRTGETGDMAL
jgi:nitrogen regulatory protein P-II 2